MKILFIGDIVGRPGRELVRKGLRGLVDHYGISARHIIEAVRE